VIGGERGRELRRGGGGHGPEGAAVFAEGERERGGMAPSDGHGAGGGGEQRTAKLDGGGVAQRGENGGGEDLGERGGESVREGGRGLASPRVEVGGCGSAELPNDAAGEEDEGRRRREPEREDGAATGRGFRGEEGGKTRGGNDGGAVGLFARERGRDGFARQGVGLAQRLPFAGPVGVGGQGGRDLGAQRGIGGIFQGPPGQVAKVVEIVVHTR
jgi:hypothetical protein